MYHFTLNDTAVTVDTDIGLLEYLREAARLTSVKSGCEEGVCGSCSVLVDGRAVRACKLTASKVHGKTITTVEGLSARDREVFAWAFASTGAVQCGFCMPGMLIGAKSLLNENPAPTLPKIKSALRYNLCRCTGYSKIERAIHLAAAAFREGSIPTAAADDSAHVGARTARVDSTEKLLGTGEFVDDMQVVGMLHAAVLRTTVPRALIRGID